MISNMFQPYGTFEPQKHHETSLQGTLCPWVAAAEAFLRYDWRRAVAAVAVAAAAGGVVPRAHEAGTALAACSDIRVDHPWHLSLRWNLDGIFVWKLIDICCCCYDTCRSCKLFFDSAVLLHLQILQYNSQAFPAICWGEEFSVEISAWTWPISFTGLSNALIKLWVLPQRVYSYRLKAFLSDSSWKTDLTELTSRNCGMHGKTNLTTASHGSCQMRPQVEAGFHLYFFECWIYDVSSSLVCSIYIYIWIYLVWLI